ncbi:MAG: pyrroline-5-carboxylate reductase [Rhizobiales bacterium 24-66-13]|nr:MAG: pyrroline-5-carboxylate reductase [Rhizobiales bacterium 24-66-13]
MTQTTGRIFDEMARLVNDAAGVAQGMRREAETVARSQMERFLRDMDLVAAARLENERLAQRLAELEAKLAAQAPHAPGESGFSGTPGAGPGPV